jgi:ABC-type multidrug transport system ATPase subunit
MDEADRCDRVALMQRGRLLAVDRPGAIGERYPHPLFAVRAPARNQLLQALRGFPHAASVYPFGEEAHYSDNREGLPSDSIADELRAHLQRAGIPDAGVAPIPAGIEDAFMALMGEPEGDHVERAS